MLFLVGTADSPPGPPQTLPAPPLRVVELLVGAGLMSQEGGGNPEVTEAGFRFLLLDTYTQLWALLREYISMAERDSGA